MHIICFIAKEQFSPFWSETFTKFTVFELVSISPGWMGSSSPQEGCAPAEAQDGWAGRRLGVAQEGGKVRGAQRSWISQFSMVHKMGNDFTKRQDIRIYIDYYSFWPDVIEAYPGVQDYWVVSMECVAVKIRNKNGLSALKLKWPLKIDDWKIRCNLLPRWSLFRWHVGGVFTQATWWLLANTRWYCQKSRLLSPLMRFSHLHMGDWA